MALDAEVSCSCYQQGLVISPFPEHTVFDEDGRLVLDLPGDGHEDEEERFWAWKRRACAHPFMNYCAERIANWAGYRLFQEALGETGWELFPTLDAHLPNANGGTMPVQAAAQALAELETFTQVYQGTALVLVNAETGDVEQTSIAAYEGVFRYGPKYEVGFDAQGLFVRRRQKPLREYFRSLLFEQRPAPGQEENAPASNEVMLTDLVTGQQFTGPVAVTDAPAPVTFRVEERAQTAERFASILEPLTRICRAAVETGNPVRWC